MVEEVFDMSEYEIPLVIFTVMIQWAVGIILAVVLLEWLKPKYIDSVGKLVLQKTIFLAFGISVIGTIASLFHLGSPLKGYTSIIGMSHSWLSREIIAVVLLNICLLALTYIWWKNIDKATIRKTVGTITAVVGVITIISSAMAYFYVTLHPTWHSWPTFANFLLTGFLLGTLTVVYYTSKVQQDDGESVTKVLGTYLAVILIALLVTIAGSAFISNGMGESQLAASITFSSVLFWIRVLGSLLVPASLIMVIIFGKKMISNKYMLGAVCCVFIGELSGRMLFYYSVMSQYPWF